MHSPFLRCKVTINLEFRLPKGTKLRSPGGPFACYDVYLCKTPNPEPQAANGPRVGTPGRAKGRGVTWEDDSYPPSPPCSVCGPLASRQPQASAINGHQRSGPRNLHPYGPR